MFAKFCGCLLLCCCFFSYSKSQSIAYTDPDRGDVRGLNFEVVGRINEHYLIYKNYRNDYNISIYDNDMKQLSKEKLSFLPDKVINTDILAFRNFFYFFYQFQRRNIVYCMAAKMDGDGKLMDGEPKQLDTTHINFFASNKVYSFIASEDKRKIAFVKINTRSENNYIVTSLLLNDSLVQLDKTQINVEMPERNSFLTEFNIDNDGNLVFVRAAGTAQKENISSLTLITKNAFSNRLVMQNLQINSMYLDDVRLKVDNVNKRYLVTSFYSKNRRGNVDGLYTALYNTKAADTTVVNYTSFSDDLRKNAKSEGNDKYAFNDFFLQNIVMRKDGGFIIASESVYSSSRGNQFNRWDYFNNMSYYSPLSSSYYYSPFYNPYGYYYPWSRSGFGYSNTRYFADNVVLLSFDPNAKLSGSNIIHKSQYDDNTDDFIGYNTLTTGGEIHFLYNEPVRKNILLSDQTLTADGEINRKPTLKNLDRGYEFMPRLGRQVAAKQMIIPCLYRNYICFAKVEF